MKKFKLSNGFSLIETMVAMGIMSIVIVVGVLYWNYITSNYTFSMNQYELTDQATFIARQISTEVRQAEEAMNGGYSLEILDDNELAFYADVDNDGLVERRRYFLDNGTLKKGVVEPEGDPPNYILDQEIITLVVNKIDETKLPLFVYYNGNWPEDQAGNPLSYWQRPLETRLIKISLPVYSESDLDGYHSFVAENLVGIRNLKDN